MSYSSLPSLGSRCQRSVCNLKSCKGVQIKPSSAGNSLCIKPSLMFLAHHQWVHALKAKYGSMPILKSVAVQQHGDTCFSAGHMQVWQLRQLD